MSKASLLEFRQLVPRYDHALHPCFRDHHQVSHAPADVVSAHGQSQSCEHRDEGNGGQGGSSERKKTRERVERGDGSASGGQRFGFVYTLMMDFLHHNCKNLKYYCTLTCWQGCWLILLRYCIKTKPNMGAVGVRWLASQTGSGWKALTVSAACMLYSWSWWCHLLFLIHRFFN